MPVNAVEKIDAENLQYIRPPLITSLDYSADGAVGGFRFHEVLHIAPTVPASNVD